MPGRRLERQASMQVAAQEGWQWVQNVTSAALLRCERLPNRSRASLSISSRSTRGCPSTLEKRASSLLPTISSSPWARITLDIFFSTTCCVRRWPRASTRALSSLRVVCTTQRRRVESKAGQTSGLRWASLPGWRRVKAFRWWMVASMTPIRPIRTANSVTCSSWPRQRVAKRAQSLPMPSHPASSRIPKASSATRIQSSPNSFTLSRRSPAWARTTTLPAALLRTWRLVLISLARQVAGTTRCLSASTA
mmetsp:Transcript_53725/g.78737  ORF Transcript_53725/g.78737 Transcript_53725/m.78737 type:complete len:250 (+) Transcript_53725:493-1242(+)